MSESTYLRYKRKIRKSLYILEYFMFKHRKTVKKLSLSYRFTDIHAYGVKRWYTGVANAIGNVVRHFYKARLDGENCFIKIAKNDITIDNEIFINKYLMQCGITFVPKLLFNDNDYGEGISLFVTEFNADIKKFRLPDDEKAFENICSEFEHIHECFKKFGIIHGDISLSNIYFDNEDHLFLIDFGIGWAPGSDVYQVNTLEHRGTYYIQLDDARIYDNAFSFLRVLDDCGISDKFKQKECYKKIERLVGVHKKKVMLPPSESIV